MVNSAIARATVLCTSYAAGKGDRNVLLVAPRGSSPGWSGPPWTPGLDTTGGQSRRASSLLTGPDVEPGRGAVCAGHHGAPPPARTNGRSP